ncbi:PASTA domain-containing protein, partial [Pseudomonas sp. BGM005]|nr:PASTA domain-containing protein [Pseudomonas sp. BG5]
LAVLLASVLFWVWTISMRPSDVPTSSRTVPDLVNVSSERAQQDLGELDLTAKLVLESSTDIAEGNVTRTDPTSGTAVS